jgi:hypothetical protein
MKNTIHIVHPEGFQRVFTRETQATNPCDIPQELFDEWNHGSGSESKEFIDSGARSLSVGDFVGVDGNYWQCKSCGWEIVKLAYVNNILNQIQENMKNSGNDILRTMMKYASQAASREYREQL